MIKHNGLTLIELLVVMAVLSITGIYILNIFTSSLRGSNKSQELGIIKQNGQAVLDAMDGTIRNADNVVCVSNDGKSLVVAKNGIYTRYRFTSPLPIINPTSNGYIQQDTPDKQSAGIDPGTNQAYTDPGFVNKVCTATDPLYQPITLTDNNTTTGVSINCLTVDANGFCVTPVFTRSSTSGFKDQVTIKFLAKPAINAPNAVAGQIDPVTFQTTINLR